MIDVARDAVAAGQISHAQARVIDTAIDTLSSDLPEAALVEGEQILLDQAETHEPVGLTGVAEQLFAILDPIGYQQAKEDKLAPSAARTPSVGSPSVRIPSGPGR